MLQGCGSGDREGVQLSFSRQTSLHACACFRVLPKPWTLDPKPYKRSEVFGGLLS